MKQSNRSAAHSVRSAQIGDDRRPLVGRINVQDVPRLDSGSEPIRIPAILHFKNVAPDIASILRQELLDVMAVNRRAPVEAPVVTQGAGPAQGPKPSRTCQLPGALAQLQVPRRGHERPPSAPHECVQRRTPAQGRAGLGWADGLFMRHDEPPRPKARGKRPGTDHRPQADRRNRRRGADARTEHGWPRRGAQGR